MTNSLYVQHMITHAPARHRHRWCLENPPELQILDHFRSKSTRSRARERCDLVAKNAAKSVYMSPSSSPIITKENRHKERKKNAPRSPRSQFLLFTQAAT